MKNNNLLKAIFVTIGVLVSVGALVAVVYTVFKKYFQVTFECDGDCCDCGDDCCEDCDACDSCEDLKALDGDDE